MRTVSKPHDIVPRYLHRTAVDINITIVELKHRIAEMLAMSVADVGLFEDRCASSMAPKANAALLV